MSGVFGGGGGSKKKPMEAKTEMAAPTPAATAAREGAEADAATRRASRRGGMRGMRMLMSEARLGGDSSTLGTGPQ
jgi:hypothetical protein